MFYMWLERENRKENNQNIAEKSIFVNPAS